MIFLSLILNMYPEQCKCWLLVHFMALTGFYQWIHYVTCSGLQKIKKVDNCPENQEKLIIVGVVCMLLSCWTRHDREDLSQMKVYVHGNCFLTYFYLALGVKCEVIFELQSQQDTHKRWSSYCLRDMMLPLANHNWTSEQ